MPPATRERISCASVVSCTGLLGALAACAPPGSVPERVPAVTIGLADTAVDPQEPTRSTPVGPPKVRLKSHQAARFEQAGASSEALTRWLDDLAGAPLAVLEADGDDVRVAATRDGIELCPWVALSETRMVLERLTPVAAQPGAAPSVWLAGGTHVDLGVPDQGMLHVFIRHYMLSTSFHIDGFMAADGMGHQFVEERPAAVSNATSMLGLPTYAMIDILDAPGGQSVVVVEQGTMQVDVATVGTPEAGFQRIRLTVDDEKDEVVARIEGYVSVDKVISKPEPPISATDEGLAVVESSESSGGRCLSETIDGVAVGRTTRRIDMIATKKPTISVHGLVLYVGDQSCATW